MRFIALLTRLIAASALVAVFLVPAAATAATVPTPRETGCPVGWLLLSLDELEGQGYIFGPGLDVNADRYICGKPLAPPVQEQSCSTFPDGECPVPILYYVRDNNVTRH